jgi:transposase-like protein
MNQSTVLRLNNPELDDPLTEVLQAGAKRLLAQAIEAEVEAFLASYEHLQDQNGRARIVRNGYLPERDIQTGIGPVTVKKPRVRDRAGSGDQRIRFTSNVLPRYLRRSKSVEELIPWLYLKGVSTGDFQEALSALLGSNAPGLSASTVSRLKQVWHEEFRAWQERDLSSSRIVYLWVDGAYFGARLEEAKNCILIVMGATSDGKKELLAVSDGYRESEHAWRLVLLDLKQRGLRVDPKLAVGDGALGFWKALPQVYGSTRPQRCWVHKSANVTSKLPKAEQPKAKGLLRQIYQASSREAADRAFDHFVSAYEEKYPKAAACLEKDRLELLTFFDFPARHWQHLRTTNPIESTIATVRLRTKKTRNAFSREAMLSLVFKLFQSAERRWLRLKGSELLQDVLAGVVFDDGVKPQEIAA